MVLEHTYAINKRQTSYRACSLSIHVYFKNYNFFRTTLQQVNKVRILFMFFIVLNQNCTNYHGLGKALNHTLCSPASVFPEYREPEWLLSYPIILCYRTPCYYAAQPVVARFVMPYYHSGIARAWPILVSAQRRQGTRPDFDQWWSHKNDSPLLEYFSHHCQDFLLYFFDVC